MADIKIPGKVLSHVEDKALRQRADDLAQMRDGTEVAQGLNHETKDKSAINKEIHRIEETLAAQSAAELSLSPNERDQVSKEEAMLRADLQKDMPSWKQYYSSRPSDGGSHTALVNQIVKWERDPARRAKVKRWQNLRRILDPHDPKAASTVHLFR